MIKGKLFFILTTTVLLIFTACSGAFMDPGAGAFGGGGGIGSFLTPDKDGGGGVNTGPQTETYTGEANGQLYTLKITENTESRYTARYGDDYELTAGGKRSTGKVVSGGSNLSLKPDNSSTTFTVTISAGYIREMDGNITWTNGDITAAPATLTVPSGGGGVGSLNLSGQVYTDDFDFNPTTGEMKTTYTPYTGTISNLTSNAGGSGSIRNGQLSFSVGAPPASKLEPFKLDTGGNGYDFYKDARVSPSDARGMSLDFEGVDLSRINMNMSMNNNTGSISITMEMVAYTYVDKNCTITATGGTFRDPEYGFNIPYPSLNINLNQGWNTINIKMTATQASATLKLDRGDLPSCKWVIDEYNYGW